VLFNVSFNNKMASSIDAARKEAALSINSQLISKAAVQLHKAFQKLHSCQAALVNIGYTRLLNLDAEET
jgi:hypothetical protein